MAVFRVERNKGYTVMSNHHLRNKELSLKAKGLLSQMLSLPEDWDYTLKGLSLINREKIDAIREAIKELERAGYIVRSRERDEKGRLRGADYVIFEQPQPPTPDLPTLENPTLDNPMQEKPMLEKPTLENPMQLNKDIPKTDLPTKEKTNTDLQSTHSIPILDRRFYCFGCGATGDVIDFVSRLHGIGSREAALMLVQDFSIPYEDGRNTGREPIRPRLRRETEEQKFKHMEQTRSHSHPGGPACQNVTW